MILGALSLLRLLAVASGAQPLSVADAMRLAVERNVAAKLAAARGEEARGRALRAAAELLPQVSAEGFQNRVYRENLAAMGFAGQPGIPQMLGPFNVFDARAALALQVFDLAGTARWRAARRLQAAATLEENLAREQVAAAAALSYIEALRAHRAIRAAQAGVDLAVKLTALAQDQRRTGTATGLDVARAETREAEERLRLLEAGDSASDAELRLKRLAGLTMRESVELTDALSTATTPAPAVEEAVSAAGRDRLELRVLALELEAREAESSAVGRERLPGAQLRGDGGVSGTGPDRSARAVGQAGVFVQMPLFAGGAIRGREEEARGLAAEAAARLEDTRLAVEEDVRRALDRLAVAAERVVTSAKSVALAGRELDLARSRFAAGVGDNIELVNAQTVLARAQDRDAAALAALAVARVNLALALGRMQKFRF